MTESHDLSEFAAPGVTGIYGPPLTPAERRAADEELRVREAERAERVDQLVRHYQLDEGTVVRDAVNVYWRLTAVGRIRETLNFDDAWWETFGDEGAWRLGEECPHGSERSATSSTCHVRNCPGRAGPALPLTVISH